MKKSVVSSCLKTVLFVFCFALLAWMVVVAGPAQLWQTLTAMPWTILACVAVWGVGYALNASSFRQILLSAANPPAHPQLHWWQVLKLTIAGYAINYITPLGLLGGEPYRVLMLRPVLGGEKATQSVIMYSMMHIASHCCLWLLSIVWMVVAVQGLSADHWYGLAATLISVIGLLGLLWYLYRHGIMLRFVKRWVDWPLLNPNLLSAGIFVKALGLELESRLFNVIEYWIIMQALGFMTFGYGDALLVVAFSSLLANLLFFSPLQMGSREGGILLALQYLVPSVALNLPSGMTLLAVAVALSFATRLREFIWIAIGLLLMRMSGTFVKEKK